MFTWKRAIVVFCVCFSIGVLLWILPFFFPMKSGRILDKYETGRGNVRLEITAYAEQNSFSPGTYHVVEAVDASNNRVEVITFRHDDPVPIKKDGVVIVNDDVAYVFIGWMYAVTTDGGRNWSVWNAQESLPDGGCCNYFLIKNIELDESGNGKMFLDRAASEGTPFLTTENFGRSWH